MQVLVDVSRKLFLDELGLEEQVVTEGAYQGEPRILFGAELFDEGAKNRERGGLFAALLFAEPTRTGRNMRRMARPRSFNGRSSTRRS
jgi:hypothetical protein